jgi:2-iminobutanoate/2-iminopropanoate deaminase
MVKADMDVYMPDGELLNPRREITLCPPSIRHGPFPVGKEYRGIYAHGVETRPGVRTLYVSGQVGQTPEGHLPPDFRGQCRQALVNVSAVLAAASMTFTDIVKMSFFLVRREDMESLVEARKDQRRAAGDHDGVRGGLVSPDWLVEGEVVACAE